MVCRRPITLRCIQVEKEIMLTEEEYLAFEKSGGDKAKFLQQFMKLEEGETIDKWEKASTVYGADSDDEFVNTGKVGKEIVTVSQFSRPSHPPPTNSLLSSHSPDIIPHSCPPTYNCLGQQSVLRY